MRCDARQANRQSGFKVRPSYAFSGASASEGAAGGVFQATMLPPTVPGSQRRMLFLESAAQCLSWLALVPWQCRPEGCRWKKQEGYACRLHRPFGRERCGGSMRDTGSPAHLRCAAGHCSFWRPTDGTVHRAADLHDQDIRPGLLGWPPAQKKVAAKNTERL